VSGGKKEEVLALYTPSVPHVAVPQDDLLLKEKLGGGSAWAAHTGLYF